MTREDPAAFAPPPAFGPFRVLHQIGVGALGPVFRTYEPTRDRLIAVKVFRLDITPEQAQALADELSKAADAGLFHPSIVEPVAAGVEDTVAYRAEEYVAAESLDVAIRHYAPASIDTILPFVTQLAGAIDFARAAGVGHGALHLRDIFVTPEEARASGFGVVEALERVGLRAPVRRPYSAPERIAGQGWSTPADVFSLAAICYELLTARRPAGVGDQSGTLAAGEGGEHAAMIQAVLARAMDETPSARYPSALAFASALEAAARGERASGTLEHGDPIAATGLAASALVEDDEAPRAAEPDAAALDEPQAELDDIAIERDEDEVYYDLAEEERLVREARDVAPAPDSLFEDEEVEAAEDLALELPPERFTDVAEGDVDVADGDVDVEDDPFVPPTAEDLDDADAGGRLHAAAAVSLLTDDPPAEDGTAQAPIPFGDPEWPVTRRAADHRLPASPVYGGEESDRDYLAAGAVAPAPRPTVPIAIGVLIGLLVGFAAGYAVFSGGEQSPGSQEARQAAEGPGAPGPGGSTAQVVPSDTEQPLAAAVPPDVPDEVPPPDSPATPAEAPATGSLVISSTPAKAGVTINGQWRGRTPLRLEKQPFGTYNVRVVQEGFSVATEQVVLSASAPTRSLSFRLERPAQAAPARQAPATKPAPATPRAAPRATPPPPQLPTASLGSIFVDSRPRGARVSLNGKAIGTTPMRIPELPIGSHVVRLELDNHQAWATSARVQAGQETRVTGSLEPIR